MAKKADNKVKNVSDFTNEDFDNLEFEKLNINEFNPDWDFLENPIAIGKVTDIKSVTFIRKKKGKEEEQDAKVMTLSTKEGDFNVWQSKCLEPIFEMSDIIGKIIKIEYIGIIKIKGGGKYKKFRVYFAKS